MKFPTNAITRPAAVKFGAGEGGGGRVGGEQPTEAEVMFISTEKVVIAARRERK